MGMIVSVYTDKSSDYDCTCNGITNQFSQLCVINVPGPFEPRDDMPAVKLVKGTCFGDTDSLQSVHLVPVDDDGNEVKEWTMFGGNFASTSDSRLGNEIEKLIGRRFHGAIPVHDRIETRDQQYMGGPR